MDIKTLKITVWDNDYEDKIENHNATKEEYKSLKTRFEIKIRDYINCFGVLPTPIIWFNDIDKNGTLIDDDRRVIRIEVVTEKNRIDCILTKKTDAELLKEDLYTIELLKGYEKRHGQTNY